ncbi:MAG: biotin transporter BioY [Sphaerochaetaceae bacterium]|nr:biotin transporter BioY [Sphaerochaetaceae bacterium]
MEEKKKFLSMERLVLISLFSALIIAGTFLRIPLPPIPVTLQTFFVYLAALALGPVTALLSVLVYLFLGLVGLPVFTSGGGFAAFAGPTGGFLIGMLPAAFFGGLIAFSKKESSTLVNIIALVVATLIIYALGTWYFSYSLKKTIAESLVLCCYPFLIGDAVKIVTAVILAKSFRPRIQERLNR